MFIKILIMLLLAGVSYGLAFVLLVVGLPDWWIAMIVGLYCTILFDSLFFAWSDQHDAEKRVPVLDPSTVYQVTRAWNYSKPGLCLTSCDVEPVSCIEFPDQGPPIGFREVPNLERTKLFWVPDKVFNAGRYHDPVFDSFH